METPSDATTMHADARGISLDVVLQALDLAPVGVVITSTDAAGAIRYVNHEFTAITGYRREDLPNVSRWLELAYPDEGYRAKVLANWPRDVHPDNMNRDVVYDVTCRDGTVKAINLRASLLEQGLMLVTLHDVTSRRARARELRTREATLKSIFRAAPLGIGLVRRRVFEWCNDHLLELVGYSAEEMVGHSARMLYASDEEYQRVGREKYDEIAARGVGTVETRWVRKDGQQVEVLLSSCPLDPDNLDGGVTFTARDISGRKRDERERTRLQQQVLQSQKLESLGVLAGGIAHDFNNLLLGIIGNVDLALEEIEPHAPAHSCLRDALTAARQASDLARQMLAYSGRGHLEVRPLDLNQAVREVSNLVLSSVSKRAELELTLHPEPLPVRGDSSQIQQILINLVTNASEALKEGAGRITVRTGVRHCDRACLQRTTLPAGLEPGRYCFFEVSDTGHGMDARTLRRIFDPFFTTKFTGRGLGLATAQGIVRSHGGALRVDSRPGEGTRFRVLLPETPLEATAPTGERAAEEELAGSGCVLLVDDEEMVRGVGRRMLERLGFEVLTADDGQQALEVFREHRQRIRCVILDLTMPRMDGQQAARVLHEMAPSLPLLLSSGFSEHEALDRGDQQVVVGFVRKPYRLRDLKLALHAALTTRP